MDPDIWDLIRRAYKWTRRPGQPLPDGRGEHSTSFFRRPGPGGVYTTENPPPTMVASPRNPFERWAVGMRANPVVDKIAHNPVVDFLTGGALRGEDPLQAMSPMPVGRIGKVVKSGGNWSRWLDNMVSEGLIPERLADDVLRQSSGGLLRRRLGQWAEKVLAIADELGDDAAKAAFGIDDATLAGMRKSPPLGPVRRGATRPEYRTWVDQMAGWLDDEWSRSFTGEAASGLERTVRQPNRVPRPNAPERTVEQMARRADRAVRANRARAARDWDTMHEIILEAAREQLDEIGRLNLELLKEDLGIPQNIFEGSVRVPGGGTTRQQLLRSLGIENPGQFMR